MGKSVGLMTAVVVLAAGVLFPGGVASGADVKKLVMDGSTTVGPVAKAFVEYYKERHKGVNITLSESGSGNGAKSLINGACDIANMSRFMKE